MKRKTKEPEPNNNDGLEKFIVERIKFLKKIKNNTNTIVAKNAGKIQTEYQSCIPSITFMSKILPAVQKPISIPKP